MKAALKISGMHCKSCEMLIADTLDEMKVKHNFKGNLLQIEFSEKNITLEKIKKAIQKDGYGIEEE